MSASSEGTPRARREALLEAALALPAEERALYLRRACEGDEALRRELTELVQRGLDARASLEEARAIPQAPRTPSLAGLELCGYRIERELGRGGTGVVYLAEQSAPRRKVAIKLLRFAGSSPGQLARFRREAEILARLRHPGLAQVLEAGQLEGEHGALPWIALEYVEGEAIDVHVARRRPSLRELVALFALVCEAVAHAHAKGIVHRDLKPSNVLVDATGGVRVLDFGVARLSEEGEGEASARTRTGEFVGTLSYASPEQLAEGRSAVDARSDVHALGVMLFELATGALPYPVDEERVAEAVRAITGEEPLALRRLRPDAPAELETVLRKAMEKDPRRRYADAGALRDELERWLAGRPIAARPPTAWYQLTKLVRRHPAASFSIAALFVTLSVSVLALALSGRAARRQLAETSATLEFLADELFRLVPVLGFGEEQRASLEELERRLGRQLEADPANRALRLSRAWALFHLSALDQRRREPARTEERAQEARAILVALAEADPTDLACRTLLSQVYARLGEARRDQGDLSARDAWFEEAYELDQRLVCEHPDDGELLEDLGWSLCRMAEAAQARGDTEEAFRLARRRLADAETLVLAEPDNSKYVHNLTHAYSYVAAGWEELGEREEASRCTAEMLRWARRLRELEPERRDYVLWLLHAARASMEHAARTGDLAAAERHAWLAFSTSLELAFSEPRRPEHLGRVLKLGTCTAGLELELGRKASARNVLERMQDVLALWADVEDQPPEVGSLAVGLRELETLLAELPD